MNQRNTFYNFIAQTSPAPMALEIVKALGVEMWDKFGKVYIDMISGISVSNVGHCHPKVVEAVKNQAETYMHLMVYGEYIQNPQVQLAQKICSLLPPKFDNVYFVNSGSEANEGALKLAKRFTGKPKIVYCKNAYHGSTQGVLSIIGSDYFKNSFLPLLPEVYPIEFNNLEDIDTIDNQTACVIMENVQAEAGIVKGDTAFLNKVRQRCDEMGALLIFDEVQTGFGRTGNMFGWEISGVQPDIFTFAKGMGGGMPIGAFVAPKEIMQSLTHQPVLGHITTFGGHPVSCAASLATIQVLEQEKLVEQVHSKESYILSKIQDNPIIKNIRSVGLLLAIEFESAEINFKVIQHCIQNGVITDWFLFNDQSLRLAPPLTITFEELDNAMEKINLSIQQTAESLALPQDKEL